MIYLVRHGQTDWNLFRKFNGVTDTSLNQTGIAQAKLQAENLRNVSFDACFCSDIKIPIGHNTPAQIFECFAFCGLMSVIGLLSIEPNPWSCSRFSGYLHMLT